jgi:hypothetical protein
MKAVGARIAGEEFGYMRRKRKPPQLSMPPSKSTMTVLRPYPLLFPYSPPTTRLSLEK